MAEINTDNLVLSLLTGGKKGYPVTPDTKNNNGIVWYSQNSYTSGTCANGTLTKLFKTASKSQKGKPGKPEYVIDTPDFYVVIEDKDEKKSTMFSGHADLSEYIGKGYDTSRLYKCPIDDVLWYAEHLKTDKDVVAVANYSDGTQTNFKSATFFFPKGGNFGDVKIMFVGGYEASLHSISDYKTKIAELNGETERTYEQIYDELRKYAVTSSKFLYKLGVDDADRLGLVSIIALALTNKKSELRNKITNGTKVINKEDIQKALLEDTDNTKFGIITDPKKNLPPEKIAPLRDYVQKILTGSSYTTQKDDVLTEWDRKDASKEQFFAKGENTVLSRVTYSIYNNIITKYDKYTDKGIDIMGTFYSLFLVYYASDKKKGIVLTPSHVTKLFCDIADYFSEKKISKDTVILDICTGSGGFLIAALNYIDKRIDLNDDLTETQKKREKEKARKHCLIGAEIKPNMFMLAYANMNFHGDGSSRLYNLDSLQSSPKTDQLTFGEELCKLFDPDNTLQDVLYAHYEGSIERHENEPETDYKNRIQKLVANKIFEQNGADIGLINPPYGQNYNEYDFINAELQYLKKGGIGLAIVPVSNQSASKNSEKIKVLEKHALLASILMPTQLFTNICNSGASIGTCILVFKAHTPHQDFLKKGGKTYLADWREDGFKMVNKHGRFEDKNRWYATGTGYHDMYMADLEKTLKNDYNKLRVLDEAYRAAFPQDDISQVNMIPSSSFKKDIHNGGIKSISVRIFDNPHTIERQKTDKDGNPKWKEKSIRGQKIIDRDSNGDKIPVMETIQVWDNMDWSILDYVKTDYRDLSNADFIKTLRNYKLYQYMLDNNMLFNDTEENG